MKKHYRHESTAGSLNGRLIFVQSENTSKTSWAARTSHLNLTSTAFYLFVPFYQPFNKLITTLQSLAIFTLTGSYLTLPALTGSVTAVKLLIFTKCQISQIVTMYLLPFFHLFLILQAVFAQFEFHWTELISYDKLICMFLSMHDNFCMKCHWNITARVDVSWLKASVCWELAEEKRLQI